MKGLILFDIDQTLTESSEGHGAAFTEGFKKIYGVDATTNIINAHGMTDQQIIIEVLKKKGLSEQQILPKINECMDVMIHYFNSIKESIEIDVLRGVPELLEELKYQGFLIGLVTGNLEPIGRSKMKKINLNNYFKVGGFGSDNISRSELVNIAIKKAKERFDFTYDNNVFLFGDTPKDVKAGQEAGVKTVGVSTGIYSKEELENANADFVIESLEDKEKILNIVSKSFYVIE